MIRFYLKIPIVCVSFSRMDYWLCIYLLFVGLELNASHNNRLITISTQSSLVSGYKSPWFDPLIFSTSSVGTLWVCSSLSYSIFGSFWIMVVFPLVPHLTMSVSCKHPLPVCRGWNWIFKNSIHLCHHCLAFPNLVLFWLLLWLNQGEFSLRSFLKSFYLFPILLIHSVFL